MNDNPECVQAKGQNDVQENHINKIFKTQYLN